MHRAVSPADGDKERLDFTCVITGYEMLIVQSGVLWDVTLDMCMHTHTHTNALKHTLKCCVTVSTQCLCRLAVFVAQLLSF